MAIDTQRKRASVASLGLAFLGASIVPDGSFVEGDRQTIGHGYYGLSTAATEVSIGGTSQLNPLTSSGTIANDVVVGGSSQLNPVTSSGGITSDVVVGGPSQLNPLTSEGGLTSSAVEETESAGGGLTRRGRILRPKLSLQDVEKRKEQQEQHEDPSIDGEFSQGLFTPLEAQRAIEALAASLKASKVDSLKEAGFTDQEIASIPEDLLPTENVDELLLLLLVA